MTTTIQDILHELLFKSLVAKHLRADPQYASLFMNASKRASHRVIRRILFATRLGPLVRRAIRHRRGRNLRRSLSPDLACLYPSTQN